MEQIDNYQEIFSNRLLLSNTLIKHLNQNGLLDMDFNYAYINNDLISAEHENFIGAHNGYLALLVQYGLLLQLAFLSSFSPLYSIFTFVKSN